MPQSHETKWFGCQDIRISKLLTDPAGGSATYASSVNLPGAKEFQLTGSVNLKTLRGDNQLLAVDGVAGDFTLKAKHGKLSIDALSVMEGGTVTDTGSAPNQVTTYDYFGGTALTYWKVECQNVSVDTPGGDGHLTLWKCVISSFPVQGMMEEDYDIFEFEARPMPRISDNKWKTLVLNQTAVAIP